MPPPDQQPGDSAEPAPRWSRRALVQSLLVGGALTGLGAVALLGRRPPGQGPPDRELPSQSAATPPDAQPAAADPPRGPSLNQAQLAALAAIQQQILPMAGDCPRAAEIGGLAYLEGALADPRTSPDDIATVLDGLAELQRLSAQRHRLEVQALSPLQLEALLRERQAANGGAEWLGLMIVFALEALLGDPVYGGSLGERGWRWLGLTAPEPRPSDRWYKGLHG